MITCSSFYDFHDIVYKDGIVLINVEARTVCYAISMGEETSSQGLDLVCRVKAVTLHCHW